MGGRGEKVVFCKLGARELSAESDSAGTLILDSQPTNLLDNNFLLLSHPLYGIFMATWAHTFIIIES